MMMIYMMMFIGVIGVWDDVPVLGAYPIFWNERRVYSSLSLSDAPFQKLPSSLLKKNTASVGIVFLSLQRLSA